MASYCRFCPAQIQNSKYGGMADHVRVVHPERLSGALVSRRDGGVLLRRAKETKVVQRRRLAAQRSKARAASGE